MSHIRLMGHAEFISLPTLEQMLVKPISLSQLTFSTITVNGMMKSLLRYTYQDLGVRCLVEPVGR